MDDPRFQHIFKDPRSKKLPQDVAKFKVDKRFAKMFTDKDFYRKAGIDARGRKLDFSSSEKLKKLYDVSESSDNEDDEEEEKSVDEISERKESKGKKGDVSESSDDEDDEEEEKSVDEISERNESKGKKGDVSESSDEEEEKSVVEISERKESKGKKGDVSESSDEEGDEEEEKSVDEITERKESKGKNGDVSSPAKLKENTISKPFDEKEESADKDITSSKLKYDSEEESDESDNEESENDSAENDSSPESSDSSDTEEDDEIYHKWGEFQVEAPDTDTITRRLALCNMDWDRIRAEDLFVLFRSYTYNTSGSVVSVKIYPSEYGLKRINDELLKGPAELVEETLDLSSDEEETPDKKQEKLQREKLRLYQLQRLKYYYAVVELDKPETANALYESLNGMEFESTSCQLDLRFIPDDVTFDDQEPVSHSDRQPDSTTYTPNLFENTALKYGKVQLTWDETERNRKKLFQKAFDVQPEAIEDRIKNYLASSPSESEGDAEEEKEECRKKMSFEERVAKYKELLQELEEKEKKKKEEEFDAEIVYDPGLKDKTEELVKKKLTGEKKATPFEEKLKKMKAEVKKKRKAKRAELKAKAQQSSDDSEEDSDTDGQTKTEEDKKLDELYLISGAERADEAKPEKKTKKWKAKKKAKPVPSGDFKVNVLDPRFAAIYTSPDFNIDPSDPQFKATEGMMAIIEEKQRRLDKADEQFQNESQKSKKMRYS